MALDPFFGVKFNGFRGPGYLFKSVFWLLGYVIDCINMVKGPGGHSGPYRIKRFSVWGLGVLKWLKTLKNDSNEAQISQKMEIFELVPHLKFNIRM